jgi:hypothetical protein
MIASVILGVNNGWCRATPSRIERAKVAAARSGQRF